MAAMTVREFKKFASEIPDEFDNYPIWFIDYCMEDALRIELPKDEDMAVIKGCNDKHEYVIDEKIIKEIEV